MDTAAIICEFNPFHNGHKYLIKKAKETHRRVICIMSGPFVQRGDIAIYDKWTRAAAAVRNGADLVAELPVCYCLSSAERFAYGGAAIADKTNICKSLVFGSESGDIDTLKKAAAVMHYENNELAEKIKEQLDLGKNHPSALSAAMGDAIDTDILSSPNNILAIEYIKALSLLKSSVSPITFKRYMADHNDIKAYSSVCSAGALRKMIFSGEDISGFVPENSGYKGHVHSDINRLYTTLIYLLMTVSPEKLSHINGVGEGLENRIISAAKDAKSYDELIFSIKSKRYTLARIKRILLSCLIGLFKDMPFDEPEYLRVLAMNEAGAGILSDIKKNSSLTIITKAADHRSINRSFELDILAQNVASLAFPEGKMYQDLLVSPVVIKEKDI